jgi:hypothetical protein
MKKLAIVALAAIVAGVTLLSTVSAQNDARIRVLHASPDAPAVDVFLDGSEAISDLAFDDITDYVAVPAGDHTVEVFPAAADGTGDPVISADVTLAADTDYTVAAVGLVADIEPLVLVDDNTAPAAGEAKLRFVHASPDAPAVDIYAEGAGVVVPAAAFKDASGYLGLAAGTYNLEVRAAGTETVALDLPGVVLEEGKVYTAFAVGLLEGEPALNAKVTVDATFEPSPSPSPSPSAGGLPASGGAPPTDGSSNGSLWLIAFGAGLLGLVVLSGASRLATRRISRK